MRVRLAHLLVLTLDGLEFRVRVRLGEHVEKLVTFTLQLALVGLAHRVERCNHVTTLKLRLNTQT